MIGSPCNSGGCMTCAFPAMLSPHAAFEEFPTWMNAKYAYMSGKVKSCATTSLCVQLGGHWKFHVLTFVIMWMNFTVWINPNVTMKLLSPVLHLSKWFYSQQIFIHSSISSSGPPGWGPTFLQVALFFNWGQHGDQGKGICSSSNTSLASNPKKVLEVFLAPSKYFLIFLGLLANNGLWYCFNWSCCWRARWAFTVVIFNQCTMAHHWNGYPCISFF